MQIKLGTEVTQVSGYTEKAIDKIHHPFMIKVLRNINRRNISQHKEGYI